MPSFLFCFFSFKHFIKFLAIITFPARCRTHDINSEIPPFNIQLTDMLFAEFPRVRLDRCRQPPNYATSALREVPEEENENNAEAVVAGAVSTQPAPSQPASFVFQSSPGMFVYTCVSRAAKQQNGA